MLSSISVLSANADSSSWVKRPSNIRSDVHASIWIDGHLFKTPISYCVIEGRSTRYKETYLLERWKYLNEHCFSSKMQAPTMFEIVRNTVSVKTLGVWDPSSKKMFFHPKLFDLKDEGILLGTIIHEMAHQYVSEVLKASWSDQKSAHGPIWQQVMADLGLPVDAKYLGGSETLLNRKQRKAKEEHLNSGGGELRAIDFAGSVLNYGWFFNRKLHKRLPVIVIGNGVLKDRRSGYNGVYLPIIDVNQIVDSSYRWIPPHSWCLIDQLTKVSRLGAMTFPEELRTPDAKYRVEKIFKSLMANQRIAEVSELIMQEYKSMEKNKS